MTLIDKDMLLEEMDEAIKDFSIRNEEDRAFLAGVVAARRIVKFTQEVPKEVRNG